MCTLVSWRKEHSFDFFCFASESLDFCNSTKEQENEGLHIVYSRMTSYAFQIDVV